MKKFYYFFAMATVALVSLCCLSACGDDDEEEYKPQSKSTYDYKFFVSDEVLALGDIDLHLKGTDIEQHINVASQGVKSTRTYNSTDGSSKTYSGKEFIFTNIQYGQTITPSFTQNDSAVDALPKDGKTAMAIGYKIIRHYNGEAFVVDNNESSTGGLMNSRIMSAIYDHVKLLSYTMKLK